MQRINQNGPFLLDPVEFNFPDPSLAMSDPDGLLAVGGDLSPARLLNAYRRGVFPWFNPGEPILWWSPGERAVVRPADVHVSRSLAKQMRKGVITTSFDRCFQEVIEACAAPRNGTDGTWITQQMQLAYRELHRLGYAHSVESWSGDRLVGGLYGISLGGLFYGESMFAIESNASKIAYVRLARMLDEWGFGLIDAQVLSEHMRTLGVNAMPRAEFLGLNHQLLEHSDRTGPWRYTGEHAHE